LKGKGKYIKTGDEYVHRIKKKLKKGEKKVVHHKDGNKSNNAPSNLEVMSYSEHNKIMNHGNKKFKEKEAKEREKKQKLDWWNRVGKKLDPRYKN
jgi:hypothetical protein